MENTLKRINGVWYEPVIRLEPVPEVSNYDKQMCSLFREGQKDRKEGKPCARNYGSYLDGWYAPDKAVPPKISAAQCIAFDL